MIRRLLCALSVAAALCTPVAADNNPFVGHWTSGELKTCAPPYAADELTFKISEKQLEMDEQGCEIQSIRKISKLAESGYRLRLLCRMGSEEHADEIVLALIAKSPLHGELLMRFNVSSGIATTFQRCP
jgi:hypothetical protein